MGGTDASLFTIARPLRGNGQVGRRVRTDVLADDAQCLKRNPCDFPWDCERVHVQGCRLASCVPVGSDARGGYELGNCWGTKSTRHAVAVYLLPSISPKCHSSALRSRLLLCGNSWLVVRVKLRLKHEPWAWLHRFTNEGSAGLEYHRSLMNKASTLSTVTLLVSCICAVPGIALDLHWGISQLCEIIQYNEDQSKITVGKNRQRRWGGPESVPTAPDLSDPSISTEPHLTVMLPSITAVTLQVLGSIDKGDQIGDKDFSKDHGERWVPSLHIERDEKQMNKNQNQPGVTLHGDHSSGEGCKTQQKLLEYSAIAYRQRIGRGALRGGGEQPHGVRAAGECGLSAERAGRYTLEAESEREIGVVRARKRRRGKEGCCRRALVGTSAQILVVDDFRSAEQVNKTIERGSRHAYRRRGGTTKGAKAMR
ncbi:hypothetical protein EDB86DRAFT_3249619 [Lactarius hatsudake]|nr:hypothetical protein EDB86DRAFT_3249619 [Lactarius hatsudake]